MFTPVKQAPVPVTDATTEGDALHETHELECTLQKSEGNWLLTEVTMVEVLKNS